jgi:hypothetical protein
MGVNKSEFSNAGCIESKVLIRVLPVSMRHRRRRNVWNAITALLPMSG